MTAPADSAAATPGTRFLSAWVVCALLALCAGLAWLALETEIQEYWHNYYRNWRDPWLERRLAGTGPFLVVSGVVGLAGALGSLPLRRRRLVGPWPWLLLLAVTVGVGIFLSHGEWVVWGRPEWEHNHERGRMWRDLFLGREGVSVASILAASREMAVGTSFVPPIAIGLVAAAGLSIEAAFAAVDLLAWGVVGACVYGVARRALALSAPVALFTLVVVFTNQAVLRSLVFPQTDPFALAVIMAAVWVGFRAVASGGAWHAALLGVNVLAFFTKLSALPVWGLPVLLWGCLGGGGVRERLRRVPTGVAHAVLAAGCSLALLFGLGLDATLGYEFERARTAATVHDYNRDSTPLRFVLVLVETLQIAGLFAFLRWRRRTLGAADAALLLFALVFPLSLVVLGSAFWIRYVLPVVPLVALVGGPPLHAELGRSAAGWVCCAVLAFVNVLFLYQGLYY